MRKLHFVAGMCVSLCWYVVSTASAQAPRERMDMEVLSKIKDEGMQRSKVMESISYLTDVHGPRLTGSPQIRAAGEWTKNRLTEWGLVNAHLEAWGPFGRGWSLEGFTGNMVAPTFSPLIACPKAWCPSTQKSIRGTPIYLDAATEKDLDNYRGKLHRAIVLISPPREVKALFDSPARRQTDETLLGLANSDGSSFFRGSRSSSSATPGATPGATRAPNAPANSGTPPSAETTASPNAAGTNAASTPGRAGTPETPTAPDGTARFFGGTPEQRAAMAMQSRKWQLVYEEGAAIVVEPGRGDGGTIFVQSATMPTTRGAIRESRANPAGENQGANATQNQPGSPSENRQNSAGDNPFSRGPRPWAQDSPEILPQVVVAVEHYNRIIRMLKKGADVQLEFDIASRYHTDDPMSFNVIAEIPGSDLKDQVVMLGGHFDSWHSGTGATDNAVGCGVALEAVRILQAIGAKPRRTIRIALWTGEEQGLLGSRAYVTEHFGRSVTPTRSGPTPAAGAAEGGAAAAAATAASGASDTAPQKVTTEKATTENATAENGSQPGERSRERGSSPRGPSRYELKPEHEKFSAYFNLDNGTGKIRGIYLQGNEAARSIFRAWLTPFAEMGASTVTLSNTGGTDHQSFDGIGLPGFQFIQDPLEYDSRTHHSSMDVFDRIQEDDVKQASVIMATFVYNAAMRDEKIPRKPLVGEIVTAPEAK